MSVTEPLLPPSELLAELPIAGEAEEAVLEGRRSIRRVLDGEDGRFIVIAGPCSIHDYDAALEYAAKLASLAQPLSDRILTVMRVYFEKPRTTVGWKGLVYDPHLNDSFDIVYGLRQGRSLLREVARMGLHTATEFLDPIVPQYFADLVSWAAIGARTAESQTHRQMASGLSMPVGFKNGTGGSVQLAVDGVISARSSHGFLGIDLDGRASVIQTKGNPYGHVVLRGGSRGPNYDSESVAAAQGILSEDGLAPEPPGRLQPRQLRQGPHQDARRLPGRGRAAGRRQRGRHRLHAGEQHQPRQPEAQRRARGSRARRIDHRPVHRLAGDGGALQLGPRPPRGLGLTIG